MQPFADVKKIKTTQNLHLSINEKWKCSVFKTTE